MNKIRSVPIISLLSVLFAESSVNSRIKDGNEINSSASAGSIVSGDFDLKSVENYPGRLKIWLQQLLIIMFVILLW